MSTLLSVSVALLAGLLMTRAFKPLKLPSVTAYLIAGVAKRTFDINFSDMFSVTVNGKEIAIVSVTIPKISNGEDDYHCFIGLELNSIELVAGENVIVVTAKTSATNFDYIDIYSTVNLE